ncbi:MAG: hypothetical protein DMG39_18710 [Acidobacteria bacterium]|nr:MAG: hypothetical protein DMG39_18710 [Acidobacteriota bacterium]
MEDKQNSSEHFSGLLPPIELNPGNRRDAYPGIGRMAAIRTRANVVARTRCHSIEMGTIQ